MTMTWDEIVATVYNRQAKDADLLRKMIEVRQRYNGEWVLPYVSEEDAAQLPTTTPGLIAGAVDFLGMRAGSVMPYMNSPAIELSKPTGVRSAEYASIRRKVLGAVHHKSSTRLHLRRAFRHLAGYATTTMVIVPDFTCELPRLEMRDPLTTYPEPRAAEDLRPPSNCAFVYGKSVDWLRSRYPQTRDIIPANTLGQDMWDVVEWVDCDVTVIGVLGPREWEQRQLGQAGVTATMELHRWDNPTGMCPAYTPNRVTLDRVISQIGNLTGQVDLMDRLQALSILAGEKAIFSDRYIIGNGVNTPTLVGGQWKDGRTGEVNIVLDATSIGQLSGQPDPSSQQMIDRLERNVRIDSGLVPQAYGETAGALRTGRGMDSLLGASVDPRIQEMQEIMEVALEYMNTVALESFKAYWPSKKYELFTGKQSDQGLVEFTPSTHIETSENVVSYTIPGADVQGTTIQLGQLVGMKAISLDTLRSRHPWVDDPDAEAARVEEEFLQQAILEGIAQAAASGTVPITYLAKISQYRRNEPDIVAAVMKADAAMKEEQAAAPAPPAEGQVASPDQMPGLAPPSAMPPMPAGAPAELPPNSAPGEIGPQDNQRGLRRLVEALSQRPPAT